MRNVPAFSRFLEVAALCNGTIVNFTSVSNDAQVPRTTVYEYFEILEDTLILFELPAWRRSRRRKPIVSSKYYFFDVGVVGALQGRQVRAGTPEFGAAFETWLMHELRTYCDYRTREPLHHWRSTSGFEVDFILGEHTAIEVRRRRTSRRRTCGRCELLPRRKLHRYVCVSLESRGREVDGVEVLPYAEFLSAL